MKKILCYGDSNVWGYITGGSRFAESVRWPGLLGQKLGEDYQVIEEGLNGRNTGVEEPGMPGLNGYDTLPAVLAQHGLLDKVILMLGTNDLSDHLGRSASDIVNSMESLIRCIQQTVVPFPQIILVSPPRILDFALQAGFSAAPEKLPALRQGYRELAERYQGLYLDAAIICTGYAEDGVHLDPLSHSQLAEALFGLIKAS
ncbi:GDSL-type esterase/lipase family protein [Dongshaea marina]|uniref:GDSL-type esterase/lipase family protein n=1 Tax=Dongshaea marina TaxID=2047966 RepID=UPI000D3E3A49|nr:GDSL-type esterase/lipase family protein [Dongshaea marina]